MKKLIFELIFILLSCNAAAQVVSVNEGTVDSIRTHRYDRRLHHYRKSWGNLIPTHIKCQFAGSIGLLSLGVGWDYGRRGQWETDVMLGFLPRYESDDSKMTFTLKENYIPWSVGIGKHFSVEPFSCGLFFNSVLNSDFWTHEPDRYPKGYYNFNLRIRTHIYLGEQFTYVIPRNRRFLCKSLTFYYELSTCDLYLASSIPNKYLKLKDILSLGLGLKAQIF